MAKLEIEAVHAFKQRHQSAGMDNGNRIQILTAFHNLLGRESLYLLGRRYPKRSTRGNIQLQEAQVSILIVFKDGAEIVVPGPGRMTGTQQSDRTAIHDDIMPALKMWLFINDKFPPVRGGVSNAHLRLSTARKADLRGKAMGDFIFTPNEAEWFKRAFGRHSVEQGYAMFIESWATDFTNNQNVIGIVVVKLAE